MKKGKYQNAITISIDHALDCAIACDSDGVHLAVQSALTCAREEGKSKVYLQRLHDEIMDVVGTWDVPGVEKQLVAC